MTSEIITARIKEWLDEQGYTYEFEDDPPSFELVLSINDDDDRIGLLITVYDDDCIFDFHIPVDEVSSLGDMIHFIVCVNNGIRAGGYRYDFEENLLSYHSYLNLAGDATLTDAMLEREICGGWEGIEGLYPFFYSIMKGTMSATEAMDILNGNEDEESEFESPLQRVRYKVEHEYLPVEFELHTEKLLERLKNADDLFAVFEQHFQAYNVENPYDASEFKVFEHSAKPYHIKRLVLPKSKIRLLCDEIYLVYPENDNSLDGNSKRYFTIEYYENEDAKGKMLCEWSYSEADEEWSHVNYGNVKVSGEGLLSLIKKEIGV
ncbi:hypothetical protein [Butyrivibrio fibrisolvens]|uniref:hypothetical protein n=1 Tax=Butyrivibrio fibrisolvens TaxID=831 RepID=UPI0003FD2C8E|nr:hypothetical protein [Butyrivibrio fibrisolvens]